MTNDSIGDDHTQHPSGTPSGTPPAFDSPDTRSIGDQDTVYSRGSGRGESLVVGALIGDRWEVVRQLGHGGMGVVHLCRDRKLNREVAIKRILATGEVSPVALERFRREADAITQLSHPQIVHLYDHGSDAYGPYIVMELLSGSDLSAFVREHGKLAPAEVLRIARQICQGLAYAHSRGIVHRDLKPSNLFRLPDGSIKILDFGLARVEADGQMSMSGVGMGTLDYAAPEQRADASKADVRSDLWSLGATLYHLSTGRSPQVLSERQVPESLRELIVALTMEMPHERPASIAEALKLMVAAEKVLVEDVRNIDGDDLRCPKCKRPNTLEAKLCRGCGQSLRTSCLACACEHRHGLEHCDQCGASRLDVVRARGMLAALESSLANKVWPDVDKQVAVGLKFVVDRRLGPVADAMHLKLREAEDEASSSRNIAENALIYAVDLAGKGCTDEAIEELHRAREANPQASGRIAELEREYREQGAEICERIRQADELVNDHALPAIENGELHLAENALAKASEILRSAPAGRIEEQLGKIATLRESVEQQRSKARVLRIVVRRAYERKDLYEARAQAWLAARLDKHQPWLASEQAKIEELFALQALALNRAEEAAALIVDLVSRGKLTKAHEIVAEVDAQLAEHSPLHSHEGYESAKKQLARVVNARNWLIAVMCVLLATAVAAWLIQRHRGQVAAKVLRERFEQITSMGPFKALPVPNALIDARKSAEAALTELDKAAFMGAWSSRQIAQDSAEAQLRSLMREVLTHDSKAMLASVAPIQKNLLDNSRALAALGGDEKLIAELVARFESLRADRVRWASVVESDIPSTQAIGYTLRWRIYDSGLPWKVRDRKTGIEMVLLPEALYRRGRHPEDASFWDRFFADDLPAHDVLLTGPLYLGVYEVTRGQWAKLKSQELATTREDSYPIDNISWDEIDEVLRNHDFRLPSEAEWEFACRAGTERAHYDELWSIAWVGGNSGTSPSSHMVGRKRANAFGLHDMLGNVEEWCWDRFGKYDEEYLVNPSGPQTGRERVVRGGSVHSDDEDCGASQRKSAAPDSSTRYRGFRVARRP